MFKLLFVWPPSKSKQAPRGREEMFKQRLLSLPAEKWRESIIMKNAFILSCHPSFSPLWKKKHCCANSCVLARRREVSVTFNMHEQKWKNNTSNSESLEYVELELIPNDEESQTVSIKKGAWWWLTSVGYISLPHMIMASSSILQ